MSFPDGQVYLALLGIAVEPRVARVRARAHVALKHLENAEGLEGMARPRHRFAADRGSPASKATHEPRLHDVELWGLGEDLSDVGPEEARDSCDVRRLEDRHPCLDHLVIGIAGIADVRCVEQLARACCADDHEVVGLGLAPDVDGIPHVSLKTALA